MTSWPFPDRASAGVTVRVELAYDVYTGPIEALVAAGIIERSQLPPQPGRRPGKAEFFPDGSPVPPGCVGMARASGYRWIAVKRDGLADVKVWVSKEENNRRWRSRQRAAKPRSFEGTRRDGSRYESYEGTREQMLELGVPAEWMDGTATVGKHWTQRTIREPERTIKVRYLASTERFDIAVEIPAKAKAPIPTSGAREPVPGSPRSHLRIVWSV